MFYYLLKLIFEIFAGIIIFIARLALYWFFDIKSTKVSIFVRHYGPINLVYYGPRFFIYGV